MSGKFLVLEYTDSAMAAYINRNDYDNNLVDKRVMAKDPLLLEQENMLLKQKLEAKPEPISVPTPEPVEREPYCRDDELYELKRDNMEMSRIINNLKRKVAHKGYSVHWMGVPCGAKPLAYGVAHRTTVDPDFITCKSCIRRANQEMRNDEKKSRSASEAAAEDAKADQDAGAYGCSKFWGGDLHI